MQKNFLKALVVGIVTISLAGQALAQLQTECGSVEMGELMNFINRLRNLLVALGAILAAVMVAAGGMNIITSEGETEKMEKGRRQLLYAVVGLIIIIISYALALVVKNIMCGQRT
jgi:uncharacterized membrane protein